MRIKKKVGDTLIFRLHKLLHIDINKIHSIGIFTIVDKNKDVNSKYIAMYFKDNMAAILHDINDKDEVLINTSLNYIFDEYITNNPDVIFENPEEALFNVFKILYETDHHFKKEREI